jgi:hypothetical protein
VTTFPVYRYACRSGQTYRRLLSFCGDHAQRERAGDLHAPDGARLHRRSGVTWLQVPKPGATAESWLLTAEEAVADARDHKRGLRWEPAPAAGVAS